MYKSTIIIRCMYLPHPISSLLSQQSVRPLQRYFDSTHSPLLHWNCCWSHGKDSSHPVSSSPCKHSSLELHRCSDSNHRPSWHWKNWSFKYAFELSVIEKKIHRQMYHIVLQWLSHVWLFISYIWYLNS